MNLNKFFLSKKNLKIMLYKYIYFLIFQINEFMMTLLWESRLSVLNKFFIKLPCDQNFTHTLKNSFNYNLIYKNYIINYKEKIIISILIIIFSL